MTSPTVKWRLQGGYSNFLEGSELELDLAEGPLAASFDVLPLSLVKQKKPIEFLFRVRRSIGGTSGPGLRWRIAPEAEIRAVLLFAGNAFLGNFRVPAGHFAVQWDIEARAEGSAGGQAPFLLGLKAGTRLYQSWVSIFAQPFSMGQALKSAWQRYRDPFNPMEVQQMAEREVIRWQWEGHAQVQADFSWGVGAAWTIPGSVPFVDVQKQLLGIAGLSGSLFCREEGQFRLQLRRQGGELAFRLVRDRSRRAGAGVSVGLELRDPIRFNQLGFKDPEPLEVVSDALGQPILSHLNRICEEALTRRLRIALSVSQVGWKSEKDVLQAAWSDPKLSDFAPTYCRLLEGRIPTPTTGLQVKSRLESVRGRNLSLDFTFLNWLKLKTVKQRESKRVVTIGPTGEVVLEECESLQKATYRWDALQFLGLVNRETTGRDGKTASALWTWGIEDKVSQERFRALLRMALHAGIIRQFSMPPKSAFPLRIRLVLGTRFSRPGLEEVKLAGPSEKWKAIVHALELVDPDRYARDLFWRDWINYPSLRSLVDRDPVQASLITQYPVPDRTEPERMLVVQAYRAVKSFLALLEHWKREENAYVLRSFEVGLDVPIFVFFHLLCPAELKSSAAVLTGDVEQTWGDLRLFEEAT